jgi:hypothetical protein
MAIICLLLYGKNNSALPTTSVHKSCHTHSHSTLKTILIIIIITILLFVVDACFSFLLHSHFFSHSLTHSLNLYFLPVVLLLLLLLLLLRAFMLLLCIYIYFDKKHLFCEKPTPMKTLQRESESFEITIVD